MKIHTSAGNGGPGGGTPTTRFGVGGTDLGFLFEGGKTETEDGSAMWVGGLFGDTFTGTTPGQGAWRSPVALRTSNRDFLDRGIRWDNAAAGGTYAGELWPYKHVGDTGRVNGRDFNAFTIIPNDVLQLPDGNYLGNGFRVKRWGSDNVQRMCWTLSAAWFWSNERHADRWDVCRHANDLSRLYEWKNEGINHYFQNNTMIMVPGDENVYVFGSPEGRKRGPDSGIYLRRANWKRLCDDSAWEFWGWNGTRWVWGRNVRPTPILKPVTPGGTIGEINAQWLHGRVVLTYCDDVLGVICRTADRPDRVWTDPRVLVTRAQEPSMYAPSVHPWSPSLEDAYMHLSSWRQVPAPVGGLVTVDYATYGYRVNLTGRSTEAAECVSMDSPVLAVDTSEMGSEARSAYIAAVVDNSTTVGGGDDD